MVELAGGPFGLGPMELVIILLVLVMLFGATRLTDLGSSLGQGIKEFRKNIKDDDDESPSTSAAAPPAEMTSPPPITPTPMTTVAGNGTVQAIKCPNCEALNSMTAKHCNQCGSALTTPVS